MTQICLYSAAAVPKGSLSNNVFERRTSTGTGLFWFFDGGFAQIFSQIASITVKKLRNTNFISSRHVKRENTSLPVDVRRSKTPLLKLPNNTFKKQTRGRHGWINFKDFNLLKNEFLKTCNLKGIPVIATYVFFQCCFQRLNWLDTKRFVR